TRADEWLKEAAVLRDRDDVESAIRLLRRSYEEIKRDKVLYSIEVFLRLPLYLQQAGKSKEAWQEFNNLLFQGYPNQPKDPLLIAQDRSKIFEKMRQLLDRDNRLDIAGVYGIFGLVCKNISIHKENRNRELRTWFTKNTCTEILDGLKNYK